jgi:regulator of replication initiation timing
MKIRGAKPAIYEPRKFTHVADDETISMLLDHLERRVFNVSEWEFHIPNENRYVKYDEVVESLKERYPPLTVVEMLKTSFLYLPQRLRLIHDELKSYFKRVTLNREELVEFVAEMESFTQELQGQLKESDERLQSLERENALLQARVEGLRGVLSLAGVTEKKEAEVEESEVEEEPKKPDRKKTPRTVF